jgi:hypothetical protein
MDFVAVLLLVASLSGVTALATDRGAGLDPNGTGVSATSSLNTDKGLGVDPNG